MNFGRSDKKKDFLCGGDFETKPSEAWVGDCDEPGQYSGCPMDYSAEANCQPSPDFQAGPPLVAPAPAPAPAPTPEPPAPAPGPKLPFNSQCADADECMSGCCFKKKCKQINKCTSGSPNGEPCDGHGECESGCCFKNRCRRDKKCQ